MKRILFFMATLLLSAGAFAQNVNSNTRVYGDVNGVGVVNINDVVAVVNIILTPALNTSILVPPNLRRTIINHFLVWRLLTLP